MQTHRDFDMNDKSVFFLFEEKAQLFPEAQLYG